MSSAGPTSGGRAGDPDRGSPVVLAALLAGIIVLVAVMAATVTRERIRLLGGPSRGPARRAPAGAAKPANARSASGGARGGGSGCSPGCADGEPCPECRPWPSQRLSWTSDADPLVTGSRYAESDYARGVFARHIVAGARASSHANSSPLAEFSSSGGCGDVGVDLGPGGGPSLAEQRRDQANGVDPDTSHLPGAADGGRADGIPENWLLPSTPLQWYAPRQRDYFGPEGPHAYAEGLFATFEPDHDPLVGASD